MGRLDGTTAPRRGGGRVARVAGGAVKSAEHAGIMWIQIVCSRPRRLQSLQPDESMPLAAIQRTILARLTREAV